LTKMPEMSVGTLYLVRTQDPVVSLRRSPVNEGWLISVRGRDPYRVETKPCCWCGEAITRRAYDSSSKRWWHKGCYGQITRAANLLATSRSLVEELVNREVRSSGGTMTRAEGLARVLATRLEVSDDHR
jgi:hypothetical protein